MRFLVITDLHQKASALEWIGRLADDLAPDATLFLGDAVGDDGTLEQAIGILKGLPAGTYYVPGNMDPRTLPEWESPQVRSVHGKGFEVGGVHLAALGACNTTIMDTPFELSEEEIAAMLRPVSKEGMVLMTHAPSYGTLDVIPSGLNVGSTAIRAIVDEFHPVAALSGHIHESTGIVERDGTLFMNPGPAMDGHAGLLTVEGGRASAELVGPADV